MPSSLHLNRFCNSLTSSSDKAAGSLVLSRILTISSRSTTFDRWNEGTPILMGRDDLCTRYRNECKACSVAVFYIVQCAADLRELLPMLLGKGFSPNANDNHS